MTDKETVTLPPEIRNQIDSLIKDTGLPTDTATRDRFQEIWLEKYRLFGSQIDAVGMVIVHELPMDDPRGAIFLTYSGSLVSLGTGTERGRWLEYASIKCRTDVPELVRGDHVSLASPARQDSAAVFEGSSLKRSSSLFRIAVCPEGTSPEDQERRIKEATIFLTNGFVKLNRSLTLEGRGEVDQFTMKSVISYVARKNDITQNLARSVIEDYLSTVETGLLLGERASFGKIGTASLRYQGSKKARVIKNLRTGEDLLIPAKPECLAPKFSFSQAFKDKCACVDPTIHSSGEKDEDEEE